jgi:hypothetical protein
MLLVSRVLSNSTSSQDLVNWESSTQIEILLFKSKTVIPASANHPITYKVNNNIWKRKDKNLNLRIHFIRRNKVRTSKEER